MNIDKFNEELKTLKEFFEFYCNKKHSKQIKNDISLTYKESTIPLRLNLCEECFEKIKYSFERLQECPHEIKPRCRKCPNPCYEKKQWKEVAKIMRFSGINLNLLSLKDKIKKFNF